jgi:ribonuclease J
VVPLGGLGRIGGNMMVYETLHDMVMVDCGMSFPSDEQPGVDYVIPDITYVRERQHKLRGIVLTHGHEDHLGALPYLLPELSVPVYGTNFTMALLRAKLAETPEIDAKLVTLADRATFELGGFGVELIPVTHSIPDAVALALTTPVGMLVHTGDFKIDRTPLDGRLTDTAALRALGDRGVTLLLSDSTNVERDGRTPSETEVGKNIQELIKSAPNRVAVTTFSSNIDRIQSVIHGAEAAGRFVVPVGRSMGQNLHMALERGFLVAKPGTIREPDEVARLSRKKVVLIVSGTQGEPGSAMTRLAAGELGAVRIEPGDRVLVSARKIPGNERAVGHVINNLYRIGVEVVEDRDARIHASGHAQNDEQREMLELVRPRFFVPLHGELRHMVRHARLAQSCGVAEHDIFVMEDGNVLELDGKPPTVSVQRGESVQAGLVFVDGGSGEEVGEVVLRDRRLLSELGLVICVAIFDAHGALVGGPDVITRGVVHEDENEELLGRAAWEVEKALQTLDPKDEASRALEIKGALRRFFKRELSRRPLVLPVVMSV